MLMDHVEGPGLWNNNQECIQWKSSILEGHLDWQDEKVRAVSMYGRYGQSTCANGVNGAMGEKEHTEMDKEQWACKESVSEAEGPLEDGGVRWRMKECVCEKGVIRG